MIFNQEESDTHSRLAQGGSSHWMILLLKKCTILIEWLRNYNFFVGGADQSARLHHKTCKRLLHRHKISHLQGYTAAQ